MSINLKNLQKCYKVFFWLTEVNFFSKQLPKINTLQVNMAIAGKSSTGNSALFCLNSFTLNRHKHAHEQDFWTQTFCDIGTANKGTKYLVIYFAYILTPFAQMFTFISILSNFLRQRTEERKTLVRNM